MKSLQLSPRREGCKFTLVKLSAGCYNKNRKNAPGGIFPKFTVIFSITAHLARLGGYFFLSIAKIYPVATMSNTIAPISDISAHPLSGERHRLLLGTFHRYYMEHIEQMSNMFYIISPHRKRGCCAKLENFMQQSLVIMSAVSLQAPLPPLRGPPPPCRTGEAFSPRHISFPRQSGGSGERSEPIGAFVQQPLFTANCLCADGYLTPQDAPVPECVLDMPRTAQPHKRLIR